MVAFSVELKGRVFQKIQGDFALKLTNGYTWLCICRVGLVVSFFNALGLKGNQSDSFMEESSASKVYKDIFSLDGCQQKCKQIVSRLRRAA